MNNPTLITIYWNAQDLANQGWAYYARQGHEAMQSGSLSASQLTEAITEACAVLGVNIPLEQFHYTDHGQSAVWSSAS